MTYYCNSKASSRDVILHVFGIPTMGGENVPVNDGAELLDAISAAGATRVMFAGAWMPRLSMSVGHPNFAATVREQFAPPHPRCDERGCHRPAQDGDIFCDEHRRLENERSAAWHADPDNQAWVDSIIDR